MKRSWKKLSERHIRLNRYRSHTKKRFRLPNGYVGDFYTRGSEPIVCALVLTPERKVVLAKQFRPGPEKIMWELPGGSAERDTPRQAIAREVREETGYTGRIRFLGKSTNDGWTNNWRYHFLITGARQTSQPQPDPAESIELVTVSIKQLLRLMRTGRMTDAETAYRGLAALNILQVRSRI